MITDANGAAVFNGVAVGPYRVTHTPAQGFSDAPDQNVTVTAGATVNVEFISDPLTGNVSVVVKRADGTPVPGATVNLEVIVP